MISSQGEWGETCPRIKLAISQRAAILPGADLPSLSGYASACNAQPKTATDLLQIVNLLARYNLSTSCNKLVNLIIDNQKNGLETQAKASMLLTRHP